MSCFERHVLHILDSYYFCSFEFIRLTLCNESVHNSINATMAIEFLGHVISNQCGIASDLLDVEV